MKSSQALLVATLCIMAVFAIPAAADNFVFSGTSLGSDSGGAAGVATAVVTQLDSNTLDVFTPDFLASTFNTSEIDVLTHISGDTAWSVTFGIAGYNFGDASITVFAGIVGGDSVIFGFPSGCCSATIMFASGMSDFDVYAFMIADGGTIDGSFNNNTDLYITAKTPEPASLTLMGLGAVALKWARRKRAA